MAIKVNMGTKKAQELIYDMGRKYYKGETLYDVYGRCSAAKRNSWESIRRECERLHGENLHITGASSHFYSCMYAYPVTDDDGVISAMVLRKETSSHTYDLEMPLDEYKDRYGI